MHIFIGFILAGKNELIYLLALLLILDFATGFLKSVIKKVTNSKIAKEGAIKHTSTFVFYYIVTSLSYCVHLESLSSLLLIYILLTYAISIIENLGVMGVPIPKFLENKVKNELKHYDDILNKKED